MHQEKAVAINRERLIKTTIELIDIYSPSGKEIQIVDHIAEYLKKNGISYIKQPVSDERCNLLINTDTASRDIVFMGHIDTVPAYNLDDYKSTIKDNMVIGLGACDMKGACAAMIEAFICYKEKYGKLPPISLALVVGEEESGDGAACFCDEYFYEWAVIGEPTSMYPAFSHFGYLEMSITTTGTRKHASMVNFTKNAVHEMLAALNTITKFLDTECRGCVYNLRDVSSSNAGFVVAERCEAWIDIHIPPFYTAQHITEKIKMMIENNFPDSDEFAYDFPTMHTGYSLQKEGIVPEIFSSISDKPDNDSFPSDSDGAILWKAGIKPVIIGPGSLAVAHTQEEFVCIDELVNAAETYFNFSDIYSKQLVDKKTCTD